MTLTKTDMSRRNFLSGTAALSFASLLPVGAFALNSAEAEALINGLVGEINRTINSGKSETSMYGDFERIFVKYSDVPTIARSTLGPDARNASSAQMTAFTRAFQGYIARKYGKRFREFIGGKIQVNSARALKSFFEVKTTAILKGEAPFELIFLVSNKSGKDLFFDMIIEGISLLKSEKTEIGAMLDRRRGDLNAMIEDLKRAG